MPRAARRPDFLLTGLALVALILLPLDSPRAQRDGDLGRFWGVYGTLDRVSWSDLADVQPLGRGGPFTSDGLGLTVGGFGSIAELKRLWVLGGLELGMNGLNSDVIFESDPKAESALELNRLSAYVSFRFGRPGPRYLSLDVGAGAYVADSKYIDCSVITSCFGADTSSFASGFHVGLTGMLARGVILRGRVHLVDFDPIEAIDLGVRALAGPIYSVSVGWEFGNWSRR